MVTVYYMQTHNIEWKNISLMLNNLDHCNAQELLSIKHFRSRSNSLLARMLILLYLRESKIGDGIKLPRISFNSLGKPIILEYNNLSFNISHSNNVVACAFYNGKINLGIDVEQIVPIDILEFKDVLSNREFHYLMTSVSPTKDFYSFWTQKEAYVKAIGLGIIIPLSSVDCLSSPIFHNGKTFYKETKLLYEQYCFSLFINEKKDVAYTEIKIEDFSYLFNYYR